jgi:MoxR-like ATPase
LRDASALEHIKPVATQAQVSRWATLIRQMPISDVVAKQAVAWVRASRPPEVAPEVAPEVGTPVSTSPEIVRAYVQWGAGPRATQHLLLAASALAAMQGQPTATLTHLRQVAPAVLCHRLVLNFAASADHVTAGRIVEAILGSGPG